MSDAFLPITIRAFLPAVIAGSGGVALSVTGVEPGSFQRNPALFATNSLAPVLFWSAPFTVLAPGDVLVNFKAISFMQNANGSATTMGVLFTADVDGVALPDAGVAELSVNAGANPGIQTWTALAAFSGVAPGLAPGPHVLNVYMSVFDVNCSAQTAAGEANVHLSGV